MKAVRGYIRQSKDKKKQEHSEAYQYDALMRFHEARKIQFPGKWPTTIEWYRDIDVSGRLVPFFERRGGAELRAAAQSGDIIIAHKLNRLGRDCVDTINVADWFEKRGVAIHLVDLGGNQIDMRSATGKFMLTVLAAAAEFEGNETAERTLLAIETLRREGRRANFRPGHGNKFIERDGKVCVEPDLQLRAAINHAMMMRESSPPYTYQAIAAALTLNYPCPSHLGKNGQWTWRTVEGLVKRERKLREKAA